jgi:hypothetical protein
MSLRRGAGFVSLALGPWTFVRLFTGEAESLLLFDFARHALAFGFAAQMVLGLASRVVPNFTGHTLWSPRARDAAFYLLNASMALRALEVPVGLGVWVGSWSYIAWAGPLGVLAMALCDEHPRRRLPRYHRCSPAVQLGSSRPLTRFHNTVAQPSRMAAHTPCVCPMCTRGLVSATPM